MKVFVIMLEPGSNKGYCLLVDFEREYGKIIITQKKELKRSFYMLHPTYAYTLVKMLNIPLTKRIVEDIFNNTKDVNQDLFIKL